MARERNKTGSGNAVEVADYRHDDTRKNIPPAKIAAEGRVPAFPKHQYSYSPRLDPALCFDDTGKTDHLPELLETARQRALTDEEARALAEALRAHEPWLEWAGKREVKGVEVDPVALHIHERVSAQAILKVAARQDVTRDLFADPQQEYSQAVQFYLHDIDWTNRLILGDSLQVMASLAQREDLAGKVQMIYIDPPYGIRFGSNFQTAVGDRESKDNERGLTREVEMIRAFRDTWHLGVHSYLAYLRDRLVLARDLLTDSGSVFLQMGDENVHLVGGVLDDVFGRRNRVSQITIQKTTSSTGELISNIADYVLWYAKDITQVQYKTLFQVKTRGGAGSQHYGSIELPTGERTTAARFGDENIPRAARFFTADQLQSAGMGREKGLGAASWFPVSMVGKEYLPSSKARWKTNEEGMLRIVKSERALPQDTALRYVRYIDDFPAYAIHNIWSDVGGATNKGYVVETAPKVIERCMLMTTEPGDLVLDPTCGGGTTAAVAEEWGRRWITIDTSRVAVAIARQRFLTAKFDYFELKDETAGIDGGFQCKAVPHITLKSIAQNTNLDPIFAKHGPILDERLKACNTSLASVTDEIRQRLHTKLIAKQRAEGKRAITDADTRRWLLPKKGEAFEHWTVPFDTDPDWPRALADSVTAYSVAWRAKMDEVNACITDNAEQEELVDQPMVKRGVVRVSGPFTVEAVQPPEVSLDDVLETPIGGEPEEMEGTFVGGSAGTSTVDGESQVKNVEAYLDQMLRLLKIDGVRFPDNKQMKFTRLEAMGGSSNAIHAEGRWVPDGEADPDAEGSATVAVAFGPQYGPVTAQQVEQLIRAVARRGYDDLVIAAFNFDGPAQAVIEEAENPSIRVHMAHIRPDVNPGMAGLLKEQPGAQLFTVFGQPRTALEGPDRNGDYTVTMEGVDIYNPVDNTVTPSRADKVAAWFLDTDYDGRTFCITQAFFPDKSAWGKLSRALTGVVDESRFEALSGTESLPFPAGPHKTVAVKVIDPRGNEVMRVHRLED